MRDYRRTKQTKYILPATVYHQVLWKIRDYNRMCAEVEDMIQSSGGEECYGRSNLPGDPVMRTVIRRERMMQSIDAVDYGLSQIPEVYRKGVWDNIVKRKAYPNHADRSTYGRYKSKFVYCVAEHLGLIS